MLVRFVAALPELTPRVRSSQDDQLIKSCGRRDETPFYTPVRGFASARKTERRKFCGPAEDGAVASDAEPAMPAQQKAAVRLEYEGHQVRS